MKQLLSLFLFLVPCLAWAQYPTNGNQKITLGEQTTADGLIWRGVLADTGIITPLSDTSAYIILDTANHRFYNYNRATNVWSVAGGGTSVTTFSGGTTGLTPSTATSGAVTLAGTLAVANGGTAITTFTAANRIPYASSATALTTTSNLTYDGTRFKTNQLAIGDTSSNTVGITNLLSLSGGSGAGFTLKSSYDAPILRSFTFLINAVGNIGFWNNNTSTYAYFINNSTNNMGIGTVSPDEKLHVVGNAKITAVGPGTFSNNLNITSDGTLTTATSDEKFKYNIKPINYGLETLLQLKPVNFQWIEGEEEDLGFIAQDVAEIIPEAVNTNWNSDLLFRYESLIPILTKAIQEQNLLIKALEQRLLILENK
jgi:hypothetical protein